MEKLASRTGRVHWFTKVAALSFAIAAVSLLTGTLRPLPSVAIFSLTLYATHRYTAIVLRNNRIPVNWSELVNRCAAPVKASVEAATLRFRRSLEDDEQAPLTNCGDRRQDQVVDNGHVDSVDIVNTTTSGTFTSQSALSELEVLVEHIMRDFILSWYQLLSCNEQFPKEVQYAMEDVSVALVSRTRKLGSAGLQPLVRRVIRTFHQYFIGYLRALRRAGAASRVQSSRVDVPDYFEGWHYAMTPSTSDVATELRHLRNLANLALEVLVPADVLCCPIVRRLLVALIADSVLLPLVDLLSSPDWINRQLVVLLGDAVSNENHLISDCVPRCDNAAMYADNLAAKDVFSNQHGDDHNSASSSCAPCSLQSKDKQAGDKERLSPCNSATDPDLLTKESKASLGSSDPSNLPPTSPPMAATDGIWRRMADKKPSAFRTERQNEVCEIVQEKKKTLKLPISTSFDKLGDILSNTMVELERPLEYITGNLAHYFRMTIDDEQSDVIVPTTISEDRTSSSSSPPSVSRQSSGQSPSQEACDNASQESADHHKVSFVLGRLLPMTTGPVLSDHLWGLGNRGSRLKEASKTSTVKEQRRPSVASTLSSTSSEEIQEESSTGSHQRSPASEQIACGPAVNNAEEATHAPPLVRQQHQQESPSSVETMTTTTKVAEIVQKTGGPEFELASCAAPTFTNLFIPRSEIVEEGSSGTQYVVYQIQYDAWYRDLAEGVDDVEEAADDAGEPRGNIVLQTRVVRRRFREFETLHSCLEDDPQLRLLLRGVKGPNKWSVLPFSKLDGEAIAERRLALERYLQVLISKAPLANSRQLREFLAYGSDASIAYVRKSTSDLPRLDKFLMKTMTGMFDKLKTALPNLPLDPTVSSDPSSNIDAGAGGGGTVDNIPAQQKTSDRLLGFLNFNSPLMVTSEDDSPQLRLSFDYSSGPLNCTRNVEDMLASFLVNYDVNFDRVDTAIDAAEAEVWQQDFWNPQLGLSDISQTIDRATIASSSSECLPNQQHGEEADVEIDDEIPLASAIIDFSVETIADFEEDDEDEDGGILIDREPFVLLAKIVFGQLVQRYVEQMVDELTTEAMFTHYVHLVRESIWPNGVYATQPENGLTDAQKEQLYELTLKTLKDYFPGVIVAVFGRFQYNRGMKLFLDSLQHPKLLRHLVYHLLDILVDVLLVRSRSQSIMEKLSTAYVSS